MDSENNLDSEPSDASKFGYSEGYVLCSECRNLESYWKDGDLAFFMCRLSGVSMKTLETNWRKCDNFEHTNESPIERKNQIH